MSTFGSSTSSLACRLKPSKSLPSIAGQLLIIQMCLMLVLPVRVVLLELLTAACKQVWHKIAAGLKSRCSRRAANLPSRETAFGPAGWSFSLQQRVIITGLSSLLFFYPTILHSTMSLFICKTLDPAGGSAVVYQVRRNAVCLWSLSLVLAVSKAMHTTCLDHWLQAAPYHQAKHLTYRLARRVQYVTTSG